MNDLRSMSGFGRGEAETDSGHVVVELRTINHRYFKLTPRLPEGWLGVETRLEERIRKRIRRGTVILNVEIRTGREAPDLGVREDLLRKHHEHLNELGAELGIHGPPSWEVLLAMPGVLDNGPSGPDEGLSGAVGEALEAALEELDRMRRTEGENLKRDLELHVRSIMSLLDEIEGRAPQVVEEYRDRLQERLEALVSRDGARFSEAEILKETVLLAERSDITEEIERIRSHCLQCEEAIGEGIEVGRKLEFITQEMHREVNTIGAKANDARVGEIVVAMKVEVGKIKEQVQNIE